MLELNIGDWLLIKQTDRYADMYLQEIKITNITDKCIKFTWLNYTDEHDAIRYVTKEDFFKLFTIVEKL